MKNLSIISALGCAVIVLVSVATAGAEDVQPPPRQGPPLRVACGQELQSLCPGLTGREARQCLRTHRPQLSTGCITFFQEARARRAAGAAGAPPAGGPPPGSEPAPSPDDNKD
jgi:hypothetical protein